MAEDVINVEVAYARPEAQALVALTLAAGSTVSQAIAAYGILQRFPEIDIAHTSVGIFSQPCPLDRVLQDADRVEIYRPLEHDPKEARRNRALKSGGGSNL